MILWLLACRKPAPPDVTITLPRPEQQAQVAEELVVRAGELVDPQSGLRVEVPPGWEGRLGRPGLLLRWPAADIGVELRGAPGWEGLPQPRPGCRWDFVDEGPYQVWPGVSRVRVASCVPERGGEQQISAWVLPGPPAWEFLLIRPSAASGAQIAEAEALLQRVVLP